jgi:hypothetical protein
MCPCEGPYADAFGITIGPLQNDANCEECVTFVPPTTLVHMTTCSWDASPIATVCAHVDDPLKEMIAFLRCDRAIVGTADFMSLTFVATSGSVGARYVLPRRDFASNGVNVMHLDHEVGCIWPATVTLTP